MTHSEKIAFKAKLKQFGLDLLRRRITTAETAMARAQEAANAEEKSSSGDKYETGRAMGQLEREMYARQLAEYAKEARALQAVDVDSMYEVGRPGAFIRTKELGFFVCAGLGKHSVEGMTVLFVSPLAPLARLLHEKKAGDLIRFNGSSVAVEEVF